MRVIARPRMGGKTTEIVEWAISHPDNILVVMNERERMRMLREFNLEPEKVIAIHRIPEELNGRRMRALGIDNIDLLGWRDLLGLGCLVKTIEVVTETR